MLKVAAEDTEAVTSGDKKDLPDVAVSSWCGSIMLSWAHESV